ncbi:hypothetical protein AARAC_004243 [Aspergillus arachidicola]|uniref:Uncharacterized protein n=1 Tax=Aspergillus arachidicola TaxID=656916 RepID=A0A2G7FFG5_9EURO|nr:hypothetical protein AARAC_004243 [Aspergillus arachidicola]
MTTFKILITFLSMFIFSIQTVMALPGNTNSVSFTPVHASETGAQKSPAPAEDEHFQRGNHVHMFMCASGSELLVLGDLGESDTLGSFFGQGY